MIRVKTAEQALDWIRRYDAGCLYDTLTEAQQRELICLIRSIINGVS